MSWLKALNITFLYFCFGLLIMLSGAVYWQWFAMNSIIMCYILRYSDFENSPWGALKERMKGEVKKAVRTSG